MASLDISSCAGDNCVVWKKEICQLVIDEQPPTDFKRLEFHTIMDEETVMIDWLEPTIYNGQPALILHCSILKGENK